MATLQDLINSVNTLQDSVSVLTEEVNFKKADLVQAVLESEQSETQAGQSVTLAQQAVTDAEALVVLAQQAVTDAEAQVVLVQETVSGSLLLKTNKTEIEVVNNRIIADKTQNSTIGLGEGIVLLSSYPNPALRNRITGSQPLRTIVGGYDCEISGGAGSEGLACVIFGSHHSEIIGSTVNHGTIIGGSNNKINAGAYSGIFAGTGNTINAAANNGSTILGGNANTVSNSAGICVGGVGNLVSGNTASNIGGQGNIVSGNLSTNSGGNLNTVSGLNSNNANGQSNKLLGNFSFIGAGLSNINAGTYSSISASRGGVINALSEYCAILNGRDNEILASVFYATAKGKEAVATNQGSHVISNGKLTTKGDAQSFVIPLRAQTIDAVVQLMRPDYFVKMEIGTNRVWTFSVLITATNGTDFFGAKVEGVAKNIAGNNSMVGTQIVTNLGASAGASTWSVSADAVGTEMRVIATGAAGAGTVKWSARFQATEIGF